MNPHLRRRTLVTGTAAAALGGCSARPATGERPTADPAPVPHPAGVTTPPPDRAVFAAFDLPAGRGDLLGRLADRIGAVHGSGSATVTLAAGASLFDDRFGLTGARPRRLTAMPSFAGDLLDPGQCHGDLLLQICAPASDRIAPVLADLGKGLAARWRIDGFRQENTVTAAGLPSTRNLFGFREGAGNPDPADAALMDRLVWTDGADGEPAWTVGGTYQVVRLIRFAVELWNRDPVPVQERILGRRRSGGASLGGEAEDARTGYAADPDGAVTPLDAHIRRADPRTAESERHRILRRGYSYRRNDADQGLIFVCFQRDPESGFAATQRRLTGEILDRYVLPFGGGYWFVPPSPASLATLTGRSAPRSGPVSG
ncbi:Dyp-type peroxidase [Actinoplanes sp. NPDC051851]|uniref:Dyp-type peroxidase n=1 Tax=Actinoplanes sp. NPDC051851 TaxID=3154753 RepID=UPI00342E8AD4